MERLADRLRDRAAAALRGGRVREALELLNELEQAEPLEPAWPRRKADAYRRLGRRDAELQALKRAADLYAEGGFVIQAVATCKLILSIEPDHTATQERLRALDPQASGGGSEPEARPVAAPASDAMPLDELLLTEVVPGARPVQLCDDAPEGASEIPIDPEAGGSSDIDIDLELSARPLDDTSPRANERPASALHLDGATGDEMAPVEKLRNTPLFGDLSAFALESLIARVRLVDVAEGETLFRQGDRADALYVVVDGAVVPIAEAAGHDDEDVRLAVLEAGEFFGEVGLVTNQPRNATVRALVDTRLLAIDRALVWRLLQEHPQVFPVLLRFLRERLVDRLVRTSPLFGAFARAERSAVARQFRLIEVADGAPVIEQGRPASALFAVLAGRLEVVRSDDEGDKVLADIGPGEVCGERSLLLGEAAMASVVARGKAWMLALDADRFGRILERNPRLHAVIERVSLDRDLENASALAGPAAS